MILAIMSDSHDHRKSLGSAVKMAMEEGANTLFHMGDLISPFMLEVLKDFPGRIYLVIGNNDGDQLTIVRKMRQECPQVREYSQRIAVEIDDLRIFATHDHECARAFAAGGDFDVVLYGHTHQFSERRLGDTLLLNPGDLMGLKEDRSFCLFDTQTQEVRRLFV